MPILYVHGVNVRSRDRFLQVEAMLRQWVCPEISSRPEAVTIDDAYWGDLGVSLAWGGASRPRSRLLGMGAIDKALPLRERAGLASSIAEPLPQGARATAAPGLAGGFGARSTVPRPSALAPGALADVILDLVMQGPPALDDSRRAEAAVVADRIAHDGALRPRLLASADAAAELDLLIDALASSGLAAQVQGGVLAMGGPGVLQRWAAGLKERWSRLDDLPLYAASVGLLEARKWAHGAISNLMGDVVSYVLSREDAGPGPIAQRVLDKLDVLHRQRKADDDALIVLTHSMGGQIVYDLVSKWLPRMPAADRPHIHFWCATASQVGFFEEAKFFAASDRSVREPQRVAFPGVALGHWWNVWDPNDVLSFTAQGIFEGVDDEAYDSGMPLTRAHGGYLDYPSFYRRLGAKLRAAQTADWKRS
jgi:hypothetical protein